MMNHRISNLARAMLSLVLALCARMNEPASAQWLKPEADPSTAALPARMGFDRLVNNLHFYGISIAPEAIARAHGHYATTMDALRADCVKLAFPLAQGSGASSGVQLSEAATHQLIALQERLLQASGAAEEQLFVELAKGADDAIHARLECMRSSRKLELAIEGVLLQTATLSPYSDVPCDLAAIVTASPFIADAGTEDRSHIEMAIAKHAVERLRAWSEAQPAITTAVLNTLKLQREDEDSGSAGYSAKYEPIAAAARSSLYAAELSLLHSMTKDASPKVGRMIRELCVPAMVGWYSGSPDAPRLPVAQPRGPDSVIEFSRLLLAWPELDEHGRSRIRPVLRSWVIQDGELAVAAIGARVVSQEATTQPEGKKGVARPRVALAESKLKELHDLVGLDWLKAGGAIPGLPGTQVALAMEDAEFFGAMDPTSRPLNAALNQAFVVKDGVAVRSGMLPFRWRDAEFKSVLDRLALTESQRLVAEQIYSDSLREWSQTVDPLCQGIRDADELLARLRSEDTSGKGEAWRRILLEHANRKLAWEAARECDERLTAGLLNALGETASEGRALLLALDLSRERDGLMRGCVMMDAIRTALPTPEVIQAGFDLRAAPGERMQLLAAIAPQLEAVRARDDVLRRKALALQEQYEIAWAASYPEGSAAPGPQEKMAGLRRLTDRMKELRVIALELAKDLRRANDELLARAADSLDPALAERWRRDVRVLASVLALRTADLRRIEVLRDLRPRENGASLIEKADSICNPALDRWCAEAELMIDAVDRQVGNQTEIAGSEQISAGRRRSALLAQMLLPSFQDCLQRSLSEVANAVPRSAAEAVPGLSRYLPR